MGTRFNFSNIDFSILNEVKKVDAICPEHQCQMIQLRDMAPFCEECKKAQIVHNENERVGDGYFKSYLRGTKQALRKDSIVLDKEIKNASFDNYIARTSEEIMAKKQAQEIAQEYAANRNKPFNTILTGKPGTGKSHLAMSIVKQVNDNLKPPGSCLFISVNDLLRLVKDSFNNPSSKYTEVNMIHLLGKANLLVLDDLGSESSFRRDTRESTEYVQQFLFGILDRRERTIITTNLSSSELDEIYNPKLTSRMYKNINGHIIKFTDKTLDKRRIEF